MIRVDAALFAAAQAGDPVALERMLHELQPDIRRYARRQCHRTTAIEDVVQEALIVLYRRLGNVRSPLAIAGWIFRVVTRLCMLPVLGLIRGAEHDRGYEVAANSFFCEQTNRPAMVTLRWLRAGQGYYALNVAAEILAGRPLRSTS